MEKYYFGASIPLIKDQTKAKEQTLIFNLDEDDPFKKLEVT